MLKNPTRPFFLQRSVFVFTIPAQNANFPPRNRPSAELRDIISIISMFGSTNKCEQLFSLMKKSPARSRLTDAHLGSVFKLISADKITPQIDNIFKQKRCQISGMKL